MHVAREKATVKFARLRPAIRNLGPRQVEALVLEIFDGLEEGDLQLKALAGKYGVNLSALSRFAGTRWNADPDHGKIPDLWRNTAERLAAEAVFREAAEEAGVWRTVEGLLNRSNTQKDKGSDHA